MRFGAVPVDEALGAILAHGVRLEGGTLKKGRVLSADDITQLQAAALREVTVARLEADDVPEDEAARRVAWAIAGQGTRAQEAFTGRANVHATGHGMMIVDRERVKAINHLDESLTIATLPPHEVVSPKQMLATVKIIPFATPRVVLERALAIVGDEPLLRLRPFQKKSIHLITTQLPQTKASIIAKSETAIRERLAALGLQLASTRVVLHTQEDMASALKAAVEADLILVFGASAIVDRGDVIPAGVVGAGGVVNHLGMPVDPGNLLMLGEIRHVPVIGIPSCARSPKRNGFDWVLERICAGISVLPEDIMDMGVGGLLAEIPSRPSPRESKPQSAPRVVGVVLAAGTSSRMGSNKMLADFGGKPMLRVTIENVQASAVDHVVVVTGHEHARAAEVLNDLDVQVVHNPQYADGLSTSLRAGVAAAGEVDAIVVCLGDMPRVMPDVIDRMIAAFNPVEHRSIVVPMHQGQLGNPVLWGAEHFSRLSSLVGDKGARSLIGAMKNDATEIEADESVLMDADTPEALARLKSTAWP
jgi:molybdenum cofactor cytidylyltransferase